MGYQDQVQREAARQARAKSSKACCPTCDGLGFVMPVGPVPVGADFTCTTCRGKGKV